MKTMQETFNRIVEHAASMRSKSCSADGSSCWYRFTEKDGTCSACFVGALIDDEHYSSDLEDFSVSHEDVQMAVADSGYCNDEDFLDACQVVHDNRDIVYWESALYEVAHDFNLTMPEVEWPLLPGSNKVCPFKVGDQVRLFNIAELYTIVSYEEFDKHSSIPHEHLPHHFYLKDTKGRYLWEECAEDYTKILSSDT